MRDWHYGKGGRGIWLVAPSEQEPDLTRWSAYLSSGLDQKPAPFAAPGSPAAVFDLMHGNSAVTNDFHAPVTARPAGIASYFDAGAHEPVDGDAVRDGAGPVPALLFPSGHHGQWATAEAADLHHPWARFGFEPVHPPASRAYLDLAPITGGAASGAWSGNGMLPFAPGHAAFAAPPTTQAVSPFNQADEVAFISGVYPDGTLPLYAFAAWNSDNPATYTGGYTNSAKWGANTAGTPGGTVLYWFTPGSHWNATEQQFLLAGLTLWSDVANITFAPASSAAQAQIVFTRGSDGGAATSPQMSGPDGAGVTGGSILLTMTKATISIDTSEPGFGPIDGTFTAYGGYPIMTFLHEEGHALGLGHGGPYNGSVNARTQQFSNYDTRLWSIMSYIEPTQAAKYFSDYPVTGTQWTGDSDPTGLMMLDILAIQALYGLPTSTPLSGGQTFGFNCNITGPSAIFFDFTKNVNPILTIWDMGTGNTLDLSGFTADSFVNLNPGTFSSCDGMVNNLSIAYNTAIDTLVLGGGSDTVTANNNGDTIRGGGGADHLTGGTGIDTAVYSGNQSDYTVTLTGVTYTITDNRSGSPDGSDTLTNFEKAQFANGVLNLSPVGPQSPTVSGGGTAASYTENGSGVAVAPNLIVSDPDSAILKGATVTIVSGYVSGDVLSVSSSFSPSYDPVSHTLTLTGDGTLADYQAALRSVVFLSNSDNPTNATRTISITVRDDTSTSNSVGATVSVTPVNDAPQLNPGSGGLTYVENGPAVAAVQLITPSDPDSSTLAGATVTISAGFVTGDILNFVNQSGISGSWNAATHVLTLSGTASLGAYETALRSITFSSSSDNPGNGARTISFAVSDGALNSNTTNSTVFVTPVNDAPVLGGGTSANYAGTPVAVAANAAVSDVDSANLSGATVTIASGYNSGDTLNFTNQNGISGNWNASTHVLTLSGSASLAAYQTALRSVTFSAGPTASGTRTINVVVSDDQSVASAAITSTIIGPAANTAPTLGGAGGAVGYTEQAAGVAVAAGLTVADADSANLAGATVTISAGFVAGDTLNFANQNGISGSYDSGTHVLTLSGAATVAQYQAALRSVTFSSASDDPTSAARTISFAVSDGALSSSAVTSTVNVTPVNDAPLLGGAGGSVSYTEQATGVAIASAITVADSDNANLIGATVAISAGLVVGDTLNFTGQNGISGSYNSGTGVLTLSGAATVADYQAALRSITFSSASDDPGNAARTISFTVSDGALSSAAAAATVNLTPVNDAPVLANAQNNAAYTEQQAVGRQISNSITVSDADNTHMTGATISIYDGFVAGDTLEFTNQNGISGSYNASTGVLTLTGTATVAQYQIALRSIAYSSASDDPDNGSSAGTKFISFTVTDGTATSDIAGATVTVTPVNDPSTLSGGGNSVGYAENAGGVIINGSIAVSDPDSRVLNNATIWISGNFVAGDKLNFVSQNGISGTYNATTGVLQLSGNTSLANYQAALRSITFLSTSDNPGSGTRTISFTVNDNVFSNTITSTVTVTPVNDAPVLAGAGGSVGYEEQGTEVIIAAGLTVADVDNANLAGATVTISGGFVAGDVLSFASQNGITGSWNAVTHVLTLSGSATLAQYQAALRSVTFSSPSDNPGSGTRTISFTVSDGAAASNSVTGTVTVSPVDDPASLHNDAFTANEQYPVGDGLNVFADNGAGADTDVDGPALQVIAVNGQSVNVGQQIVLASGALLTVNANGTFSYDPNHAFNSLAAAGSGSANTTATDSFTYTVTGGTVETATVTIQGADSNDTLHGTSANNTLDGGIGTDTLVLTGNQADYTVTYDTVNQRYTVVDNRGGHPDGTDTVRQVETFQYADGTVDVSRITNTVHNGDGTTTITAYDAGNDTPWASLTTVLDAGGSIASQTVTTDAGTKWVNSFDTLNVLPYTYMSASFNAAGTELTELINKDDGSRTLTLWDVDNKYAWADATVTFDINGNVTGVTGTMDGGSHTIAMKDIAAGLDAILWFADPYDPNQGAAVNETITGGTNNNRLYGFAGDDTLVGNTGRDRLLGGDGNDTLIAGGGNNALYGGTGNDTFVFTALGNADDVSIIWDYEQSTNLAPGRADKISLSGYGIANFSELMSHMSQAGPDVVFDFGQNGTIIIANHQTFEINSYDFIFG